MHEQLSLFPVENRYFLQVDRSVEDSHVKVSSTDIPKFVEDGQSIVETTVKPVEDSHVKVSSTASISAYSPNDRKTEYFRLVYRDGIKVKAIHIKGGNVNSPLAINRANQLQEAINRGASIQELLRILGNM